MPIDKKLSNLILISCVFFISKKNKGGSLAIIIYSLIAGNKIADSDHIYTYTPYILETVWLLYIQKEKKRKGDRAITQYCCRQQYAWTSLRYCNFTEYHCPKRGNSDTEVYDI